MRHAALVLLFAAFVLAANSQLTIRPQAGLENSITKISYNNLGYFSPVKQLQPQLSLRADYRFKKGFGPFAGLSTSRSLINYNFSDPETGMTAYKASLGKMQYQLQAGLQYSSKPIFFKQQGSGNKSSGTETSGNKTSDCSHYSSSCSEYSSRCCTKRSETAERTNSQNKGWSVRIQPSAGFAFTPSDKPDLVTKASGSQTEYIYNAGNNKTALLTGLGFEFARGKTNFFSLSVNYLKGLGNNETSFTSESGGKTTTTVLNSKLSGWNAAIGIPISFSKRTHTMHRAEQRAKYNCQQYRTYKYRCGKII